ncbi:MAG: hypothetical protein Q9212_005095 [Teloschistes hypoglaucus]
MASAVEAANGRALLSPAPIVSQLGHDMLSPIPKPPIPRNDPMLYDSAIGPLWSYYTLSHGDRKTLLVFCLALKLMSQRSPDQFAQAYLSSTEIYRSLMEIRHSLLDVLRTKLLSAARPSWGNHSAISNIYCKALKAQVTLSMFFRESRIQGTGWYRPSLTHSYRSSADDIAVPTTESIDFHHLMDIPLPFTTDATARFQYCHLPKMTSKHFLEDGEWAGVYYAHTRNGSNFPRFAPPMRNVRFQANLDPAQPRFVILEAGGRNALGEFSLQGRMEKESGQMTLKQVYTGGTPKWDWTCMMTPFGIVGSWGDRRQFRGWAWLWKVQ